MGTRTFASGCGSVAHWVLRSTGARLRDKFLGVNWRRGMARYMLSTICMIVIRSALCVTFLAACSGRPTSTPPPGGEATITGNLSTVPVVVASLTSSVTACPAGYAHASVCCRGGPEASTVCVEYPEAPFHQCDAQSLTFPNPRSCCPLDGSSACVQQPNPSTNPAASDSAGASCSYPCGPGGYPPAEDHEVAPGPAACTDVPAGQACRYCCVGPAPAECATNLANCGAQDTCQSPAPSPCGACPDGWRAPTGIPDLCCRTTGTSAECFSQAIQILPPGTL
jgi:hypothetical protein